MYESLLEIQPTDPLGDVWWDVARPAPGEEPDLFGCETGSGRFSAEPGGVLAAAIEDAVTEGRVADLDDDTVVAAAVAAQRLLGWAMGAQLLAMAELGRRWEATPLGERAAVAELALACGVSQYAASQRMDAATVLPYRLPQVWAALLAGRVEWAKAWEILDKTLVLSDADTTAIEDAALAVALSSNLPDLRAHLARVVLEVDPDGAERRAKDAHARRGVSFRPGPDATAVMALTASAAAVAAAEAALNRLTAAAAHADHSDGPDGVTGEDPRDVRPGSSERRWPGVTRADVLLDLIHTADTDLSTPLAKGLAPDPTPTDPTAPDPTATDPTATDPTATDPTATDPTAGSRPHDVPGPDPTAADCEAPAPEPTATGRQAPSAGTGSHGPRPPRRTRPEIVVTIPLSTLLALDRCPAALAGYGPIPAAMARELVAGIWTSGTWRCAVTDDRPGHPHATLLALGRPTTTPSYTPTAATRDFVTTRDGTCRFPGCRRRASSDAIDLDHRLPWRPGPGGGTTCECNLHSLCRNHHRLKHETRFGTAPDPGGTPTWTTPTRRVYQQPPHPLPHAPLPARDVCDDHDPPPF